MKRPMVWLSTVALIAAAMSGCCSKKQADTVNRICAQRVDKQTAMNAAQRVLEDMHFVIEKNDAEAGYISTRPLAAGQFFEFWRSDTVGCENFAENNLHSVSRTAEINVTEQEGAVCIECTVDTRRLSIPSESISGTGPTPLKLKPQQKKEAVWMDMGPDAALQDRILERIKKRIEEQG
jgi:hypothetical protein